MNTFAIINIAKKELGLDDDDYRALLKRVTGKASLRDMTGAEKLAVIDDMKAKGFKVRSGGSKRSDRAYIRMIFALWASCHKSGVLEDGSRRALLTFINNHVAKDVNVINPDALTYDQASPVIEALKAMERRGKVGA